MDQTGGRYEGEIKRLKKLTEKLDAEKQHYRRLYERQLEVRGGSGGGGCGGVIVDRVLRREGRKERWWVMG